eukprot:4696518-Ditylum_brightwellii.AAC.1
MEFEWDNRGRWKLIGSKASMLINTNQGRREINRLPSSMANRILEVWVAPDENNTKQVQVLKDILSSWANWVQMGHIQKEDAWYYY